MLHIPSYELGRMLGRFDIASGNVKANKWAFMAAVDKALNPDGNADVYTLEGFETKGGLPMFPLSITEGYFFEVIKQQHADKNKAIETMRGVEADPVCLWCGEAGDEEHGPVVDGYHGACKTSYEDSGPTVLGDRREKIVVSRASYHRARRSIIPAAIAHRPGNGDRTACGMAMLASCEAFEYLNQAAMSLGVKVRPCASCAAVDAHGVGSAA